MVAEKSPAGNPGGGGRFYGLFKPVAIDSYPDSGRRGNRPFVSGVTSGSSETYI